MAHKGAGKSGFSKRLARLASRSFAACWLSGSDGGMGLPEEVIWVVRVRGYCVKEGGMAETRMEGMMRVVW